MEKQVFRQAVVIVCLIGAIFLPGAVCDCGALVRTGWSDKWLYSVFRTIFEFPERCQWTLKSPNNATDVILVVRITHAGNLDEDDVIKMPDGQLLTSQDLAGANSVTPWTAAYRHRDGAGSPGPRQGHPKEDGQFCGKNAPESPRTSLTWPPQIATESSDIDLVLSYGFTFCQTSGRTLTLAPPAWRSG